MTTYYVDPSSGGSEGTEASPWVSLQTALNTAVAGDTTLCRGTENRDSALQINTNSGTYDGGYIKFVGCPVTGWVPDGSQFTVDGLSQGINGLYGAAKHYIWLENIHVTNCDVATGGINSSAAYCDDWMFINVTSDSHVGRGMSSLYFRYARFIACSFSDNTSTGLYQVSGDSQLIACQFAHNGARGLDASSRLSMAGCVFHGNTTEGAYLYYGGLLTSCVFDGNGTYGAQCVAISNPFVFAGCRFTNQSGAGDYGLYASGNVRPTLVGCYFGNNATDCNRYDALTVKGVTMNTFGGSDTNHGYVDPTNHNFNLRPDATHRRLALPLDATKLHYVSSGLAPIDQYGRLIGA